MKKIGFILTVGLALIFCQKNSTTDSKMVQFFKIVDNFGLYKDITYFQNRVILMKKDSFFVFKTSNFERDVAFETKLNVEHESFSSLDVNFIGDTLIGWNYEFINKKYVPKYFIWTEKWEKVQTQLEPRNSHLFRDKNYSFDGCCAGEFGGALNVENLTNKKQYFCPATCPVQVEFNQGKYYVLVRIDHLGSSNYLLEIANPDSLKEKINDCCNCYEGDIRKKVEKRVGNLTTYSSQNWANELDKLTIGTTKIMDTTQISVASLFFRNNKPHFLYTIRNDKGSQNYIGRLEDGKIEPIDSLPGDPFYQKVDYPTKKYADASLFRFDFVKNGFVFTRNDTIWLINFKNR
jgi:hypothetical protein